MNKNLSRFTLLKYQPIKRHIILPQNPTTNLIEKNLNHLGIKYLFCCFCCAGCKTTKTAKQILKNNSKNTDSLSNTGVYKICC